MKANIIYSILITSIIVLIIILYIITQYFPSPSPSPSPPVVENLTNNSHIILIGDSILNNAAYVKQGGSVTDYIQTKTQNVLNFAVDNATISETHQQLDKLDQNLNDSSNNLFISAGGNNILNSKAYLNINGIGELFKQYNRLITSVKTRLPNVNIYVLNLYYPINPKYKLYRPVIDKWNKLIQDNTKLGYKIIQTNKLLVSADDFIYDIEPSAKGANKIANAILVASGY